MVAKKAARKRKDLGHINRDLRPLARAVGRMRPDPHNVRHHDERNVEAIRASLELHGQQKPIVLAADGKTVVAGSGTLAAARLLGWRWIAAVRFDRDGEQAPAYAVTDNRTAELATWDGAALTALFRHYDVVEGGRAMLPGWTAEEVEALLAQPPGAVPPEQFPEAGENVDHACPKCGYQWSGESKPSGADEKTTSSGRRSGAGTPP